MGSITLEFWTINSPNSKKRPQPPKKFPNISNQIAAMFLGRLKEPTYKDRSRIVKLNTEG